MLYERSERYRNLAEMRPATTMRDVTTEYKEMMEAALARDAGRATKLLTEHFCRPRTSFFKATLQRRVESRPNDSILTAALCSALLYVAKTAYQGDTAIHVNHQGAYAPAWNKFYEKMNRRRRFG